MQAEDGVTSRIKNPNYYIDLAKKQYQMIREFIDNTKPKRRTLAFYMSETCTWVCGMHLAYILRDAPLFRENEMRLIDCFQFYEK